MIAKMALQVSCEKWAGNDMLINTGYQQRVATRFANGLWNEGYLANIAGLNNKSLRG